ncbi:MAG TPA: class I SAM-dependent methyltransferase, partial [Candidatus Deferrimicrobium sp.]|nr:class I SAM-dependent methyltransferase [Candidatus Deferrimicrobium sp.]
MVDPDVLRRFSAGAARYEAHAHAQRLSAVDLLAYTEASLGPAPGREIIDPGGEPAPKRGQVMNSLEPAPKRGIVDTGAEPAPNRGLAFKILEPGCGTGLYTRMLLDAFRGASVF